MYPEQKTEKNEYFCHKKFVKIRVISGQKLYLLHAFILYCIACNAQIEGMVSDAKDHEVLPFTHVYNLTTNKGAYTDINGYYRIDARQGDELQFSYVGYMKQNIKVTNVSRLNIKLIRDIISLNELTIRPGINPAHRIIDNAIAHREKNNPDHLKSYSCLLYNKLIADVTFDSTLMKPEIYAKVAKDTGSYLLVNETVVSREYRYKGNANEQIVASHTSGFKEYQQFAFFQTMLQFFHFYHDVMEWKMPVKFFLNPITPGSTSKYFFLLRDTIVSGVDSTFIISYQPRRTANFEGLKGVLYINSNGWAVQSVVAEPADYSPVSLKIQQQYAIVDSVWFPSELSLELFMHNINNTGVNGIYRGKSYLSDINLSPPDKDIRSRSITIAKDVHLKPEMIDKYRNTQLTSREDSTFRKYKEGTFDVMFRIGEGLLDDDAISVKKLNFPIEKIIRQNYTEGFRVGLGIYTNRHLSPWFSIGGYFGYGMDDRRTKYGASFSLFPEKHLDSEIKFWYANDLLNLTMSNEAGVSARKFLQKLEIETQFKVQEMQTTFDYSYEGQDLKRNAEAGFKLRYAHNEERATLFRRTQQVIPTRFPVIFFNFYWGIPGCFGSAYQYIKTEAGIERSWYVRHFGAFTFSLWGGWMSHETPFPLTFTLTDTEQSLLLTRNPDSRTRFNALTGNVYAANQYLNLFLYHDFGTLLGKTRSKVFRPRIAIAQSFGWSKLNRPELHTSADYSILDMNQGYLESGIVIEDIVRIELFNMFFFGIGGGVYGAYGGSVQKPFENTLTPKIRLTATF